MTTRHDRAPAAEKENASQAHLARVADETLKTLAGRGLLALALAGLGVGLALLLATLGPLRLREAVETRAHLGVAVASLALMGALGLLILVRGARAPTPDPASQESAPDVQA
jgi:ABC-type nickel/cobalt efflux system permease component RcnA